MATAQTRSTRSYCRVCTCQCGIIVESEGDQVVRIRGDKAHPVSKGYTCPKGRAVGQMHHSEAAITSPMMRKNGALVPVSWDEALDDIAARLGAMIDEHGPASVGIFFGSGLGMDASGFRMAEAWHRAIGTPAKFSPMTIDGCAKTLVASLVGGFPGLGPRTDFKTADCVLFIGVNPMVSHGHNIAMVNPALILKDVAARGNVWVIDPRRCESVDFATGHIAPIPGMDYAVLGYLIRELIDSGAAKPAQAVAGLAQLRAALEPFTRAHAATMAGVSEGELDALYAAITKAGTVAVETGTGVTMAAGSCNVTQWLAWALMILTGSMNRPGGVWFHPGFIMPLDGFQLPLMTDPFTPGPPSRPELRGMIGDWPCAALPDEIAAGNIRGFINLGGSLIRSFPDVNVMTPALKALELLVSFEIVGNETTALSTHVLPTKDQLERPDISLWDMLSSQLSMQYTPASVPPQGERRASWWIIASLMQRMGFEVPGNPPADDRTPGADDAMLEALTGNARRSFAEMKDNLYLEESFEFPAGWVDRHIENLGGWRLAPPELLGEMERVLKAQAANVAAPGQLLLTPRRQRRHLNASFLFLGDPMDIQMHPQDAAAAGVSDGQKVIVRNRHGELSGVAKVDGAMRRGAVSVPHGHADANVNCLTSVTEADPLTGMALYGAFPVEVIAA
jgi:anaerobic selenocysteine-containing dehydrogenase